MAATYTLMYDWATIVAKLLAGEPDGKPYRISAMYIEFENNGGAAVDIPTVARDETVSYYDDLASPRDYLRVPINAAVVESTDETDYPGGNKVTFYGQTQGSAGVGGLEFSDAVQSRVYGGALVATPNYDDPTQDLILVRFYFPSGEQLIKIAGVQCFVPAAVTFE